MKKILIILLIATTVNATEQIPGKVKRAIFRSQQLCANEDWLSSVKILSDCLSENPNQDHYLLRFNLANSLTKTDSLTAAVQHYEKAVKLNPEFINGWLSLAETSYAIEKHSTAAKAFEESYRLQEVKTDNLLYYAAVCRSLSSHHKKALSLLQELLETDKPKLDWLQTTVAVAMELSEHDIANDTVIKLCEMYPDNPSAWFLAYQFYASEDDFENAAAALKIKSYIQPLSRTELIQLGNLLYVSGVPAQAAIHFQAAIKDTTQIATSTEYEMLVSALLSAHETTSALEAINKALQLNPTAKLFSLLGDIEYSMDNYQNAYAAFISATNIDYSMGRAWLMAGYCAMESGKFAEAKSALKEALIFPEQNKSATEILKKLNQ